MTRNPSVFRCMVHQYLVHSGCNAREFLEPSHLANLNRKFQNPLLSICLFKMPHVGEKCQLCIPSPGLVSHNIISWSFINAIISSFVKAENFPVGCLYHFSICLSIGGHSGCSKALAISGLPASCCSGHKCANWRSFSLDFAYTGSKIREVHYLPKSPSQKVTNEVFEPGSIWLYNLSCPH